MVSARLGAIIDIAFSPVPLRQLGREGPALPPIGLDLVHLPKDQEAANEISNQGLAHGCTFWDNAGYTTHSHASEALLADLRARLAGNDELLRDWLRRTGKRDEVFLASKIVVPRERWSMSVSRTSTSAQYCKEACYQMRRRLDIKCIDLRKLVPRLLCT